MEVEKYLDNARKTLVEAQVLCQDVHSKISESRVRLSKLEQSINKTRFIFKCLQEQASFLKKCLLEVGIKENLINKEWSQVILINLVEDLKLWNTKLGSQVKRLETIDNILGDSNGIEANTLGYFVSKENLDILENKLLEIPNIQYHIDNIKRQYNTMIKKVSNQLINGKLKFFEEFFEGTFENDTNGIKKIIEIYPIKLNTLENELVDYLSSLTDHYDQCKLLNTKMDDLDKQELITVVQRDDNDLEGILLTLNDVVEEIENILVRFLEILEIKLLDQKVSNDRLKSLILEFKKNHEYLLIFNDISTLISTFRNACVLDISNTKELCHFYQQFEYSYQNLLHEIDRRKTVATEMATVIKSCQNRLNQLNEDDQKCRSEFLQRNGDFLPENIWPGKIDDFSPLFSLEYTVKDL